MRTAWVLSLAIGLCVVAVRAGEPAVPEHEIPIVDVVVAPGRAVVTRQGEVDLIAGRQQIRLTGLPPAMDRDSLQLEVQPVDGVQLETVRTELVASRKLEPERIAKVEKELEALDRKVQGLEDRHQVLGAELLVLQRFSPYLQPTEGEKKTDPILNTVLDPASWLNIIRFSGDYSGKKRQQIATVATEKIQAEQHRRELCAQLDELRSSSVPARIVATVTLRTDQAVRARLTARYTVGHVMWYPDYEIHASEDGEQLTLERQALIGQNSGEDWNGIRLELVSLPPDQAVELPFLSPWRIAFTEAHGSVEAWTFGRQRPTEIQLASLDALPGPETLLALREAYSGGKGLRAEDAFDYVDRLAQESLALGALGIGGGGREQFNQRSGGSRRRLVAHGGGSMATESSVDSSLNYFSTTQHGDGHWNDTPNPEYSVGFTGAVLASLLGAGHTPKVGQYKENVRRGLAYLVSHVHSTGQVGQSLFDQSMAVLALGEAYGMSRMPEYRDAATRGMLFLERMLSSRILPLTPGLMGSKFPDAIENLAHAMMAFKSCKVAGLPVPISAWETMEILTRQLEETRGGARTAAVVALVRSFLGYRRETLRPYVERIMAELPSWEPGRFHLGYFQIATLVIFQNGGAEWKKWNEALKSCLIEKLVAKSWPAEDSWLGPTGSVAATTAICSSCLEVYYRYLPIHRPDGATPVAGTGKGGWEPVNPMVSCGGQLLRFRAEGLRAVRGDGEFHRIPIDRKIVNAKTLRVTTPVVYNSVYLQSTLTNPFAEPLLEGAARIFLGHEFVGETPLSQANVGEAFVVPLGEDPYVIVRRKIDEQTTQHGKLAKLLTLKASIEITVENRRKRPVRIRVLDRVAISADTSVRVRNAIQTGGQERHLDDDGQAHWEADLPPGGSARLGATYEVEYPDGVAPAAVTGAL
jgi:hypothetical protein